MGEGKYIQILKYLQLYGGENYKKQEKCRDNNEIEYMKQGSESGKKARYAFEQLVKAIEKNIDVESGKITQWQNSGRYVKYFWCQLKRKEYKESNISLSLFAEKGEEAFRFRASVELAVEKASDEENESYKHILDIPLDDGLVYILGGNNDTKFQIMKEKNNHTVKEMGLKKVQVSFIVEHMKNDEEIEEMLIDGAKKLMKYYDLAIKYNEINIDVVQEVVQGNNLKEGEDEMSELSVKESIELIKEYIMSKGFTYNDELIENFYLSLKSKPFVILAGTSGTGKTRLVRLFSEAIGANYKLVSVRPDWSDSSDLFGHVNLKGEFVPGAIIDYIHEASKPENIHKPYFLCMDEMNLARVEYYLSDFLSIIETRHREEGHIVTDEIILDKAASASYGKVILPENLYIVGTVNMDETTFPFSKKVLDRANTIEFSYVDLLPDFSEEMRDVKANNVDNSFLKTEYITLMSDIEKEDQSFVSDICLELQEINKILQSAQAHVGYRVRDEIVFYMLNNRKADLLKKQNAFDNEIMQKILPRIQGSSASVREMLCELFKKCAGDYTGLSHASVSEQMQAYIEEKECKYRKSAEKICYMMRRFEEDGFTSYWL